MQYKKQEYEKAEGNAVVMHHQQMPQLKYFKQ